MVNILANKAITTLKCYRIIIKKVLHDKSNCYVNNRAKEDLRGDKKL